MARLAEARAFAAADQAPAQDQLGRLCQTAVRLPDQVLAISGATHPSRGDRQQPARGHRRDPGPVPLARLSTGEPKQADDARRTRVHPPLLLHGLPTDSTASVTTASLANGHRQSKLALIRRLLDQPAPAANPPQRRLSRARARTDRRRSQSLPLLWRRHARHRYLAVHQSAANPASLVSRPMTIRHRARPNSVYAASCRRGPPRARRVRVAPDTGQRPVAGSARTRHTTGPVQAGPNPCAIAFQTPSRRIPIAPRDRRRDKIPIASDRFPQVRSIRFNEVAPQPSPTVPPRDLTEPSRFPFCYGCDSRLAKEIRHVSMHCSSGRLRQHSASAPGQTLSRSTSGRRLLALAAAYDGMSRAEAAKVGGMDRQTLRDWAHRFNEEGPEGLKHRAGAGRAAALKR